MDKPNHKHSDRREIVRVTGIRAQRKTFKNSLDAMRVVRAQQWIEVKETLDRTNIVLSRKMRSQQQVKKQTEEKDLAENPENLKQSMDKRAFLWSKQYFSRKRKMKSFSF